LDFGPTLCSDSICSIWASRAGNFYREPFVFAEYFDLSKNFFCPLIKEKRSAEALRFFYVFGPARRLVMKFEKSERERCRMESMSTIPISAARFFTVGLALPDAKSTGVEKCPP
jgi:hypothetical protein